VEKFRDGNLIDLSTIVNDVLKVIFEENAENADNSEDEEILTMIGGLDG
jgi:hypothetical protein